MVADDIADRTLSSQILIEDPISMSSNSEETMPAEDRTEVMEAVQSTLTAWNTGDVDTFVQHFDPDVTGFFLDGELISEGMEKDSLKTLYRAGYKPTMRIRHPEVVVQNSTAIVTGYFVGTFTDSGGVTTVGSWRVSLVWIKQEGRWQIVHYHFSPLTPGHRQR